jgi:predicted DNA repair protein MutK
MKTYLTYGFAISMAGLLMNLGLFFTGFHTDAEKLGTGNLIAVLGGVAITVVGIVLGTKARREEFPLDEPFTYGRALVAGVMITLFATLVGIVTNYLYMHVINPSMTELMTQAQVNKFEASGMDSAKAEALSAKMMHPVAQAIFGLIIGMIFGTVISLITSAVLKRESVVQPTAVA